jgi:hypothetical protein
VGCAAEVATESSRLATKTNHQQLRRYPIDALKQSMDLVSFNQL